MIGMKSGSFRQMMMHLLASLVIAASAIGISEAGTKDFESKVLCDLVKVRCAHNFPKTKASAQKAKRKKVTSQAASRSKLKAKPVATPIKSNQPKASVAASLAPKPKPKPLLKPAMSQVITATGVHKPAPLFEPSISSAPKPGEPASRAIASVSCRADLLEMGGDISVVDPVEVSGQCKVPDPVQLKFIHTSIGRVELPGAPILDCPFARQFIVWVADLAAPVVAALAQANLAALSTGPGYECRARTADPSGKISEHASGNAVDIDGIILTNTRRIEIADVANKQHRDHRLLMALRTSACGYFTTVLGPGADASHEAHYHFDLGIHGKSGNYRICQ
jgi:hypothetical protein